jgi:hypothetical protein
MCARWSTRLLPVTQVETAILSLFFSTSSLPYFPALFFLLPGVVLSPLCYSEIDVGRHEVVQDFTFPSFCPRFSSYTTPAVTTARFASRSSLIAMVYTLPHSSYQEHILYPGSCQ